MKSYRKDQQGFGAVEALLILVIVAIVAFVGWFVYHSNQKASNTLSTANQSNSNANVVDTTSTKTATAAGARAKVIATYLKSQTSANLKSYVDKHVTNGDFTAAFKASVDSGSALVANSSLNPVYCAATAPSGFKVASTSLSGDTATVTLSQVYSNKTSVSQAPQLTMKYVNHTWSVDQYTCVASPSS